MELNSLFRVCNDYFFTYDIIVKLPFFEFAWWEPLSTGGGDGITHLKSLFVSYNLPHMSMKRLGQHVRPKSRSQG